MIRLRQIEPGLWRAERPADHQWSQRHAIGAVASLEEQRPRDNIAERKWFGRLKRAWENLDDDLRARFPEPEALRKWALIRAGWCESRDFVTGTDEAAAALAAGLKWGEPYSIVVQKGRVVFAYRAKSQGRKAMTQREFDQYTEIALTHLSELVGYDVTEIPWQEAA